MLSKFVRNNSGFSLLETLVAAGAASVVILALTASQLNAAIQVKGSESKIATLSNMDSITKTLSSDACFDNVKPIKNANILLGAGNVPIAITNNNAGVLAQPALVTKDFTILSSEILQSAAAPTTLSSHELVTVRVAGFQHNMPQATRDFSSTFSMIALVGANRDFLGCVGMAAYQQLIANKGSLLAQEQINKSLVNNTLNNKLNELTTTLSVTNTTYISKAQSTIGKLVNTLPHLSGSTIDPTTMNKINDIVTKDLSGQPSDDDLKALTKDLADAKCLAAKASECTVPEPTVDCTAPITASLQDKEDLVAAGLARVAASTNKCEFTYDHVQTKTYSYYVGVLVKYIDGNAVDKLAFDTRAAAEAAYYLANPAEEDKKYVTALPTCVVSTGKDLITGATCTAEPITTEGI